MNKLKKLKSILKSMGSVLVAYSGGVDSTFLLKVAGDVLGDKVMAVTADSATYPAQELDFARKMAKTFGIRYKVIKTGELKDRRFVNNSPDRCYFCKEELFSRLKDIAKKEKLNFVADASNVSDKNDFRPGSRAKERFKIRSPLQEAGFSKEDVRKFSRDLGLKTWNKPSLACLASRIPYGTKISRSILNRINQAENFLRHLGLRQVRIRHYNGLCRIEVSKKEITEILRRRRFIVERLKDLGYNYVTVDLEGYRTGSMNEILNTKNL